MLNPGFDNCVDHSIADSFRDPQPVQQVVEFEIIPVTKLLITLRERSAGVELLLSLKRAIMVKSTVVTAEFSTDFVAMAG